MGIPTPAGYYDLSAGKGWMKLLCRAGKPIQSRDLNEVQSILQTQLEVLADQNFKDGTYTRGGKVTTSIGEDDELIVKLSAGLVYALGFFHEMEEQELELTGIGTEEIGLVINSVVITETDDADLLDPAQGFQNYGRPGAHRQKFDYDFVVNTAGAIRIATFINGQLVTPPATSDTLLDRVNQILALRTKEKDGSFFTKYPTITLQDFTGDNPQNIRMILEGGVGYINGIRQENIGKLAIALQRPLATEERVEEPETFLTGTKVYNVDNYPYMTITRFTAIVQSGNITMTRGQTVNGQDAIPSQYQPVASVVSITQSGNGDSPFVANTDFTRNGNYITWLPGGDQPLPGSTYTLVVQYSKVFVKGIRVQTTVTGEDKTISSGTFTLAHTDIDAAISFKNNVTPSTVYVEGTHYTINKATGVVTWTGVANSTVIDCTYTYWAHSTEGDFVCRDSFRTSGGNLLLYRSPTKTPTEVTIDFEKQISLDVSGGFTPVNGSQMEWDYTYALPRVDVLVWRDNGLFEVLKGTPSIKPVAPKIPPDVLPVVKIELPAEAVAADVAFEYYDNLTLLVTELRHDHNRIATIEYNLAQFRLHQNAINTPLATPLRGVFADPLNNLDLVDMAHEDYAMAIDLLSHTASLPRTIEDIDAEVTSSDCDLGGPYWVPAYTTTLGVTQLFASESRVINKYGQVNTRAKIELSNQVNTKTKVDFLTMRSENQKITVPCDQVWNRYLMMNVSLDPSANLTTNPTYQKIKVHSDWVSREISGYGPLLSEISAPAPDGVQLNNPPTDATPVLKNQWATVLAENTTIVNGIPNGTTLTITGTYFGAGERAIMCKFNDLPVELTGINGTTEDPDRPGCVVADNDGFFQATFDVPTEVKEGLNTVNVFGRDSSDLARVQSFSSATYTIDSKVQLSGYVLQINQKKLYDTGYMSWVAAFVETLGIVDNANFADGTFYHWNIYYTSWQPMAYTIAAGIKYAVEKGLSLSLQDLEVAVLVMLASTDLAPTINSATIHTICSAANRSSTDVEANAKAMLAASSYAQYTIFYYMRNRPADPLAQTFQIPNNACLESVDLYFTVDSEKPVSVILTKTDNGVPTTDHMAQAWVEPADINVDDEDPDPTNFKFDYPVFLEGGTEYAIIVVTDDNAAAIQTCTVGKIDVNSGDLILKNPSIGSAFESPNARAWSLLPAVNLKFRLNMAKFTNVENILDLGEIEFSDDISRFAVSLPLHEPSPDVEVTLQYSLDNTTWTTISILEEFDLEGLHDTVYLRAILKCSDTVMPYVLNSINVTGAKFVTTGAYVHRAFAVPAANVTTVDVYVETYLPGGASITPKVALDEDDFETMTHIPDDQVQISEKWVLRHYMYDTLGDEKETIRVKIDMEASSEYLTPLIRNIMVIGRE